MYTCRYKRRQKLFPFGSTPAPKKRLEALAKRSRRSKSFLAAEVIATYVESEEWQLGDIHAALEEQEQGRGVSHEKVSKWLESWGKPGETKAPR